MNREVSIRSLLEDGLIEPGEGILSLDLQGVTYHCDLLENGNIRWNGKLFQSAIDWLTQLKLTYNLTKSFPVWTNIRYKGIKLNQYKSIHLKKSTKASDQFKEFTLTRSLSPQGESLVLAEAGSAEERRLKKARKRTATAEQGEASMSSLPAKQPSIAVQPADSTVHHAEVSTAAVSSSEQATTSAQFEPQLLECALFSQLGVTQPFTVAIEKAVILIMDFHSHMCVDEVVGYLAGSYDKQAKAMVVRAAFPCLCPLDSEGDSQICEREIQREMQLRGLSLVGWYHSHPECEPRPTYQDVVLQKKYQNIVREVDPDEPCIGFIVSCKTKRASNFFLQSNCFWVKALDHSSGVPMLMEYTVLEDTAHSRQSLRDKRDAIVQYYKKVNRKSSKHVERIWEDCNASVPDRS